MDVPPEARERIRMAFYEAGHTMYRHEPSTAKFRADLARFIRDADLVDRELPVAGGRDRLAADMKYASAFLLPSLLVACSSTTEDVATDSTQPELAVVEADAALRKPLFDAVAGLAGRWESTEMPGTFTEFEVSSGGSVVRERMMVGQPSEMTNMYSLRGNALFMTHYCAAGNQPHMRATRVADDRIAFESVGVSDLKSADELYMGAMTLVFVDDDTVEQHWKSFGGDESHDMVIQMKRVN